MSRCLDSYCLAVPPVRLLYTIDCCPSDMGAVTPLSPLSSQRVNAGWNFKKALASVAGVFFYGGDLFTVFLAL